MPAQYPAQELTRTIRLTIIFAISLSFYALLTVLFAPSTHAATLLPVPGTDENTDNGSCSLTEAIENINNQNNANPDCLAGDGNDDTITLAIGTYTLFANLPPATEPITIEGQGVEDTVIDGDGQYTMIDAGADGGNIFKDFTVTGALDLGIRTNGDSVLENIEIDGANWGISDSSGLAAGIIALNSLPSASEVTATNVHMHNFNVNVSQLILLGLAGGTSDDVLASADRVTINDITNTGIVQGIVAIAGLFDGGASLGSVDARLTNSTITRVESTGAPVLGVVLATVSQGDLTGQLRVTNSTITGLVGGGPSPFIVGMDNGSAFGVIGAAVDSVEGTLTASNVVVAGNNVNTCRTSNINSVYSYSGTVINNITSQGGNLTDDTTCNSYFTEPSDQNNVSALADTLGSLSDNGGLVPTIPLLLGSPAIDAGVDIMGLTADARGVARPQLTAYDSGAYEVTQAELDAQATDEEADDESLAETGESQPFILLLAGLSVVTGLLVVRKRYLLS